jgi:hypothetical protein
MATREDRIREFAQNGMPPAGISLEVLCEDHCGTYILPFPRQWSDGTWRGLLLVLLLKITERLCPDQETPGTNVGHEHSSPDAMGSCRRRDKPHRSHLR